MSVSISMKMLLSRSFLLVVGVTYCNMSLTSAFALRASPSPLPSHRQLQQQQQQPHVQPLQMAGFGGGGSSRGHTKKMTKKKTGGSNSTNKAPPPLKLKAKTQWDRYCDPTLKAATSYPVAVRVLRSGSDDDNNASRDWIEVGRVKSEDNALTEIAVALQRGIIVEHAKRLVPGQVKPKDLVEWGYGTPRMSTVDAHDNDDDALPTTFTLVDHKSVLTDAPQGVERKMGFEGTPDPKTGLYCTANSGRMLDRIDAAGERAKGSLLDRSVLPRIK